MNENTEIKNLDKDEVYKYLGVDENDGIHHSKMKENFRKEYYRRLRFILGIELKSKNKIQAKNSLAIPVPHYTFGIIDWRIDEIRAMDGKTRKLLTSYSFHHPKADIDLYTYPEAMEVVV